MDHRDLELDDLYDEYGIDLDEEEEALKAKKKRRETGKEKQESFKTGFEKKHLRNMMMKMNLKDTMRMIFGLQKT